MNKGGSMQDKNDPNYRLYLAGVISEEHYRSLVESGVQRGRILRVSWSIRLNKISGELSGRDSNELRLDKIVFPSRGKEKGCCFEHPEQEARFMYDTKPSEPVRGAIIVDPLPCKECAELKKITGDEFEIQQLPGGWYGKIVPYLSSKKSKYPLKVRMHSLASENIKRQIDLIKRTQAQNEEFDRLLQKVQSGELRYPRFDVPPPKHEPIKNKAFPDMDRTFYSSIGQTYFVNFGKREGRDIDIEPGMSPGEGNINYGTAYRKYEIELLDPPLVHVVTDSWQGSDYESPDGMGMRSDTQYMTKEVTWEEVPQDVKKEILKHREEIETEYEEYEREVIPKILDKAKFFKWKVALLDWQEKLTPEEKELLNSTKVVWDEKQLGTQSVYIADILGVDRNTGQREKTEL